MQSQRMSNRQVYFSQFDSVVYDAVKDGKSSAEMVLFSLNKPIEEEFKSIFEFLDLNNIKYQIVESNILKVEIDYNLEYFKTVQEEVWNIEFKKGNN